MQIKGLNITKLNESADVSERITMHSLPYVTSEQTKVLDKQMAYIKKLLPIGKHDTFFSSIRLPLYTTGTIAKVIKRNKKIFSGKNPYLHIEGYEQVEKKLRTSIGEEIETVKLDFYNAIYHNSQDILIVNLIDGKPEFQIVPVESVIEIKYLLSIIEFVKFKIKLPDNTEAIAEINITEYKVTQDNRTLSVVNHNLGYCPATFIEAEFVGEIRNGLLLGALSNLDWLLFFSISKRLNDLSGSFPIISVYEEECDYEHNDIFCKKGILVSNISGALYDSNNHPMTCPICSGRRFMGFGTVLKMEVPDKDDQNLMPPINVTPGDIPSLEYCTKEVERLENVIFKDLTGYEIEIPQAINEKQVTAMFENSKTIINDIARKVERLINFYFQTKADLTYKTKQIKNINYSFGTEFYLYSDSELLQMYIDLRDKQADSAILDSIYLEYLETKFRNDQSEVDKQKILFKLDTYRHLTIDQIKLLVFEGIADKKDLIFKLRKTELIEELKVSDDKLLLTDTQLKSKLFNLIKIEDGTKNDTGADLG